MKKPILFNTEMVKAILEGRKTSTRRMLKAKGTLYPNETLNDWVKRWNIKPPYQVGDILYVRETWCQLYDLDSNDQTIEGTQHYYYKANNTLPPYTHILKEDGTYTENWIWHPSIHMPHSAARIFLKVTDVRVERIQDMSIEDMFKEGIEIISGSIVPYPSEKFKPLWDGLYKEKGNGWDENPWVWVISFERKDINE